MTFPVRWEDDHGRLRTETVPRTEEIAQRTTGVHDAQCHRITAVSSLPVASSAACLVLTTPHPMCWPAQACSSFMISATLPRRPGIIKACCGRLLPWPSPLSTCRARPLRWWARPAGCTRQNLPPSSLRQQFPQRTGQKGRGRVGAALWNAVRVWGPIRPKPMHARASCRCVFMRKGPGACALAAMVVPSLAFRRVGVKPVVELGRRWVRRGLVVQEEADRLRTSGGGHGDASLGLPKPLRPVRPLAVAEGSSSPLGDLVFVAQH